MRHSFYLALFALLTCAQIQESQGGKNVLFFMSDDLRANLHTYSLGSGAGYPSIDSAKMHTPYLDDLAARSFLIRRGYCQLSTCSPSRVSVLTGRRPDTTRVWDLKTYWRTATGNFTSLPQYFKENGYYTAGMGKIYHQSKAAGGDDPLSWSAPYWRSSARTGYWKYFGQNHTWFEITDEMMSQYGILPDEEIANHAVETLQQIANGSVGDGQPFFLAVGFRKPHLPYLAPKKYFDLYPTSDIKLPDNPYAPFNMPDIAWNDFGDLRGRPDMEALNNSGSINETYPDPVVKELRRAYYSSISFIDDMVGRVLDELNRLNLTDDTIISFISDHGYQLGEHALWSKHTNFELATHVPYMISVPGLTDNGIQSEDLTELVDLFPTLVDLADLPQVPLCSENSLNTTVCTEGSSMAPLIRQERSEWKTRVFSQYPRKGPKGSKSKAMGYSMRSQHYRYTEWVKFVYEPVYAPEWDTVFGVELYDHSTDPRENVNIAGEPENSALVKQFSELLRKGWRDALPPDVREEYSTTVTPDELTTEVDETSDITKLGTPEIVELTTVQPGVISQANSFTRLDTFTLCAVVALLAKLIL